MTQQDSEGLIAVLEGLKVKGSDKVAVRFFNEGIATAIEAVRQYWSADHLPSRRNHIAYKGQIVAQGERGNR